MSCPIQCESSRAGYAGVLHVGGTVHGVGCPADLGHVAVSVICQAAVIATLIRIIRSRRGWPFSPIWPTGGQIWPDAASRPVRSLPSYRGSEIIRLEAPNSRSCGQPQGNGSYVSCAFGLEDTEGVNREHAETHLRLVAEAELRRATTPPLHGAAAPGVPGAERGAVVLRTSVVAAALYDLPRYQRDVIALQYYGNLSEAETAAALRITRGAVHAFAASGCPRCRPPGARTLPAGPRSRGSDRGARAGPCGRGSDPG